INEVFAEYCTDATPAWTGGDAVRQRMIRTDRYKLNYYHGYPVQLCDMWDDPLEQHDLSGRTSHKMVVDALLARLLADWNPEKVSATMAARVQDKALISAWAAAVRPESEYIWQMRAEDNYLGLPGGDE